MCSEPPLPVARCPPVAPGPGREESCFLVSLHWGTGDGGRGGGGDGPLRALLIGSDLHSPVLPWFSGTINRPTHRPAASRKPWSAPRAHARGVCVGWGWYLPSGAFPPPRASGVLSTLQRLLQAPTRAPRDRNAPSEVADRSLRPHSASIGTGTCFLRREGLALGSRTSLRHPPLTPGAPVGPGLWFGSRKQAQQGLPPPVPEQVDAPCPQPSVTGLPWDRPTVWMWVASGGQAGGAHHPALLQRLAWGCHAPVPMGVGRVPMPMSHLGSESWARRSPLGSNGAS